MPICETQYKETKQENRQNQMKATWVLSIDGGYQWDREEGLKERGCWIDCGRGLIIPFGECGVIMHVLKSCKIIHLKHAKLWLER